MQKPTATELWNQRWRQKDKDMSMKSLSNKALESILTSLQFQMDCLKQQVKNLQSRIIELEEWSDKIEVKDETIGQ